MLVKGVISMLEMLLMFIIRLDLCFSSGNSVWVMLIMVNMLVLNCWCMVLMLLFSSGFMVL